MWKERVSTYVIFDVVEGYRFKLHLSIVFQSDMKSDAICYQVYTKCSDQEVSAEGIRCQKHHLKKVCNEEFILYFLGFF